MSDDPEQSARQRITLKLVSKCRRRASTDEEEPPSEQITAPKDKKLRKQGEATTEEGPLLGEHTDFSRVEYNSSTGSVTLETPNREVVSSDLVLAVVDKGNDDDRISPKKWAKLTSKLTGNYLDIVRRNPGPPPVSRASGWHNGHIKLYVFAEPRSAELFKLAVSEVGEIWSGARLEAVSVAQLERRPRARCWIMAEPKEPESVLSIIRYCNPNLPTSDWRIAKLGEPKGVKRQAIIVINEESLAPLAEAKWKVIFGFSTIRLRVEKNLI